MSGRRTGRFASGEVVALEEAGVVAAVALTFFDLALGNGVVRFVLEVLVVTVTTAAFAPHEALHHQASFIWGVTIFEKDDKR